MKLLITILLFASIGATQAQDIFQQKLFNADHILKYKDDIRLDETIVSEIKNIYNAHIVEFNSVKWDLDADMSKMSKLLSQEKIDNNEADILMTSILKKEEQLKSSKFKTLVTLKNLLNQEQQDKLQELKEAHGSYTANFITSVNDNPRISLKVEGQEKNLQPLYIVKNKKGIEIIKDIKEIDPNQIGSINVLKGESAKSIYGDKGKNGVVVITLK